jgi:O-acetyl-ADP-ribose deacetylase (regulator of RNase III)
MNLTFLSRSLSRTVDLDEIATLSRSNLRKLHAELLIAISAMDEHIAEPSWENKAAYEEWKKRAVRKRRICAAFETQVRYLLDAPHQETDALQQAYQRHLERLVQEELGSVVFGEIKAEAQALARKELQNDVIMELRA